MNNERYDVVIIDSGVTLDNNHDNALGVSIFRNEFGKIVISNNIEDNIDHGTGIYGIIKHHHPEAKIFSIKVCHVKASLPELEDLVYALKYVSKYVKCKVVNISLALNLTEDARLLNELEDVCDELNLQGVVIISSFDNWGSLSFPAAFRSVIGVTTGENCHKCTDIEYLHDDTVNVCAYGAEQRVLSAYGNHILSKGNSLACAHVTGIVTSFISNSMNREAVLSSLKKIAIREHTNNDYCYVENVPIVNFKKVAIFPFNKEMHSLIRFDEMLPFEIVGVFDTKYSGYVNSNTNDLLHINHNEGYMIQNLENINYESFDTIVIGHTDRIENIKAISNLVALLIEDCMRYNKFIYSFDNRKEKVNNYTQYYFPLAEKRGLKKVPFGKLYRNPKPVLGIFGTSSRQGKFSVQLILRKMFLQMGYSVGQIGTEPSSLLFGMDACFHFGYNACSEITRYETISYINQKMNEIVNKNVDIIIVGCQSRTIPVDNGNLNNFTLPQLEFLYATYPDIFILCVNPWDDLNYIDRTIKFLEASVDGKVIALVVYPYDLILNSVKTTFEMVPLSKERYEIYKEQLKEMFAVPVFNLSCVEDYYAMLQNVISELD